MKIILLTIICITLIDARTVKKSRTLSNFGSNCVLNKYMHEEFKLALNYLNASIHMQRDTVALHGFGKMFKHHYNKQLENVNKIRNYIIKRGGIVETPGYSFPKNLLNKENDFLNETVLINKFLTEEKILNRELLEVHENTQSSTLELECQSKFRNDAYKMPITRGDPATSHFLDSHFTTEKINNLKFFADLLRKVARFDKHVTSNGVTTHHMNELGVHIIDQELKSKF